MQRTRWFMPAEKTTHERRVLLAYPRNADMANANSGVSFRVPR